MFEAFYHYLFINKKVAFPGFGTFFIDRIPAQLNFASKSFTAPIWQISFKKGEVTTDRNFYFNLSSMLGISENEAHEKVNEFSLDLKREFAVYKKITLPKIGSLIENSKGDYQLLTDYKFHNYFVDIKAERVLRENGEKSFFEESVLNSNTETNKQTETILENSSGKAEWWIDAIILAILAIAAIAFYYFQHGTLQ